MYVVMGANGQTGSSTATALLAAGHAVRVVLRRAEQQQHWVVRGADTVVADVRDQAALTAAFRGAEAAYLMNPPAYMSDDLFQSAARVHDAMLAAAADAGVSHVVALSSVGGQHAAGTGNILTTHDLERKLAGAPFAVTVLRAANFIENFGAALGPAMAKGFLPSMFLPLERRLPMQAAADVGQAAARLLMEPARRWRMVEMQGPAEYSPLDADAALSDILGRTVHAVAVPQADWSAGFVAQGLPPRSVAAFVEMFAGFNSGLIAFEGTHERLVGTTSLHDALVRMVANVQERQHA